jgi:hypothetical protein
MEGSSVGGTKCPQCSADVAAGEKFCAVCGAGISIVDGVVHAQDPAPSAMPPPQVVHLDGWERDARIGKARKWLVAISVITLISGLVFYAINKSEVEKQIREAEAQIANVDPETRDSLMKQQIGMTWDEAVAHDRGQVNLFLFINIGLAIAYLGMYFWAKRNPLAATVTALLLFITVMVGNAVYEPKTIYQGIILKIFFIGALAKAISAAQEERRLQAHMPRAQVQ